MTRHPWRPAFKREFYCMTPKMFVFDLDGTLLNDHKTITPSTVKALKEISDCGAVVTLASGRISSSMKQFLPMLQKNIAVLSLNGAVVCMGEDHGNRCIYRSTLDKLYSDHLIQFSANQPFALNVYSEDTLYTVKEENCRCWTDLYHKQTKTPYIFFDSIQQLDTVTPLKISFIGEKDILDRLEEQFRNQWNEKDVYICRTWKHYLEFLNPQANKGDALQRLVHAYGFSLDEIVAFGDGENDIPMLEQAGIGIAMANGTEEAKSKAQRVTRFSNDQDGIAREWELLKKEFF